MIGTAGTVGLVVRLLRKKKALSLRVAARALTISHVHLHSVETGKSCPSLGLLDRMTQFFGIAPQMISGLLRSDPEDWPAEVRPVLLEARREIRDWLRKKVQR